MILCPTDKKLRGLLDDALSTADRDALVRHVEECASCQEQLARLTATPYRETWRRDGQSPRRSGAEDELLRRLKQMASRLAPTNPMHWTRLAGPLAPTALPVPVAAGSEPPAVPGYEILEELGRGGVGVVYQARQLGLQRVVALKMLLAGIHADAKELARFRAEASVLARLQHPNIVQIYGVGEVAGRPYFVLEFVAGGSLAQHLQGTPQPVRPAAQLVEILARAVHAAHANGVIHRDLKPANILIADCGLRIQRQTLLKRR